MYQYAIIETLLFIPIKKIDESKFCSKIKGKTILITGASFGIGEAIAKELAKCEVNLILVARTKEKLELLKKAIENNGQAKVDFFCVDLYDLNQVEDLILIIDAKQIKVDVFISNAGKSIKRSILQSTHRFHDFKRTMAVNFFSPVQLMLYFIEKMKKSGGHLINISAINVLFEPVVEWSAYQASKTAFDQWFRTVSPEINLYGIRTSTLYLPLVKTRMIKPTKEYKSMPAMKPEHIAEIIKKIIYRKRRVYKPWWTIFAKLFITVFGRFINKKLAKKISSSLLLNQDYNPKV